MIGKKYQPSYIGATTDPDTNPYEGKVGTCTAEGGMVRMTITVNARPFLREIDKLRRALSRLRYPPKRPAKGSVSRRKMKLRKAGLR